MASLAGPWRTGFKVIEFTPNHMGEFIMTARMSDEKIALAKKLESEGRLRSEIGKAVGVSQTTLIKHLGVMSRGTPWHACACGDHVFAKVGPKDVCLVDPDVPETLLAGKGLFVMQGRPRKKICHRYAVISDWPHHHRRVHRVIMGATPEQIVDHISRDTMDNRRRNLRIATNSHNGANSIQKGGSSKYKGVHWSRSKGGWVATISRDRKLKWLGVFSDEMDAARRYDAAAIELFGEFARTNFGAAE